jgi:hypothetical protein
MPLIDTSYFIGERNIPNAGTGSPVDKLIAREILVNEGKFLKLALGNSLYSAFMTALGKNADGSFENVDKGVPAAAVPQKWKDLLNGKEYTGLDSRKYTWVGFIVLADDAAISESIIADYVFFQFMKNYSTLTTPMGEVKAGTENATAVSPKFKMTSVWNKMHFEINELVRFLRNNSSVYTEWTFQDGYCTTQDLGFLNPFL